MIRRYNAISIIVFSMLIFMLMTFYGSYPYFDDIVRLTYNYTGLSAQGRYFTEWFYVAMAWLKYTTFPDIYQFNLMIVLSGAVAISLYLKNKVPRIASYSSLLVASIFSSPFIIENIAYHIDSLGMFSSLYIAIISGMYCSESKIKNILVTSSMLLIATCFYQFSINVFICSVALLVLSDRVNNAALQESWRIILLKCIALSIAMPVYLLIMKLFAIDNYVDKHSSLMSMGELLNGRLTNNISAINDIILGSFNAYGVAIFIVIILSLFISIPLHIKKNYSSYGLQGVILIFLPVLVCVAMLYLPCVIFSSPVVQPRILIAFGFILACVMIISVSNKHTSIIASSSIIALLMLNIMNAAAFNNAQKKLINSTHDIMLKAYNATPDYLKDSQGYVYFVISGDYDHEMEVKRNSDFFPAIKFMLRDPITSPFLLNGVNRYFRTGMKFRPESSAEKCDKEIYFNPWMRIKDCNGKFIKIEVRNNY